MKSQPKRKVVKPEKFADVNEEENFSDSSNTSSNAGRSNSRAIEEAAQMLLSIQGQRKMLAYDGLHSGVPTRTTATLTPTTLKNIEQTFIELTSDPPTSVPHQAGFVPPFAPTFYQVEDSSDSSVDSMNSSTSWHTTPPPPSVVSDEIMSSKGSNNNNNNETTGTGKKRRNMGGRRPNKPSNLSPEEEEKRRVRRERNKLAAARCRRRREDHTSELLTETEGLERKKQALQNEFQNLQQKKEELEFLLDSHRAYCRMSGAANNRSGSPLDVKPQITNVLLPVEKIKAEPIDQFDDDDGEPMAKRVMLSQAADLSTPTSTIPTSLPSIINIQQHHRQNHQQLLNNFNSGHQNQKFHFQQQIHPSQPPTQNHKPSRPSSLKVPFQLTPSDIINNAGVAITTPSGGNSFNFDSLMDGGTGLTPTVAGPLLPNLNRSSLDLMTPTSEPSRFVSL